jgi:hypothetical protein
MKTLYLHIGPPKTGTTAIQAAATNAKERLLVQEQIEYLTDENKPHALHATLDLINSETLNTRDARRIHSKVGSWQSLKSKMLRSEANSFFISSEALAAFSLQHISKLRSEIGPMQIHLILTLRPLLDLMPSQWQQWVRIGEDRELGQFVEEVIQEYEQSLPSYFWNMHDTARVTKRWIEGLSPDHVSIIVADRAQPELILRHFEQVLGIRVPLLDLAASSNPSLSLEEAYFLQEVSRNVKSNPEVGDSSYLSTVVLGKMRRPLAKQQTASLHQLRVSADKVEKVLKIQRKIFADLTGLDLTVLGQVPSEVRATTTSADTISDATLQALQAAARVTVVLLRSSAKSAKKSVKAKKKSLRTEKKTTLGRKRRWLYAIKTLVLRRKE